MARLPNRMRRRFVSDQLLDHVESGTEADNDLMRREAGAASRRTTQALDEAIESLPAQDRLMLRMRFEDGFTVVEIARVLRLEAKPLYRRIERILATLRTALESRGFTVAVASEVLALGGLSEGDEADQPARELAEGVRQFLGTGRPAVHTRGHGE